MVTPLFVIVLRAWCQITRHSEACVHLAFARSFCSTTSLRGWQDIGRELIYLAPARDSKRDQLGTQIQANRCNLVIRRQTLDFCHHSAAFLCLLVHGSVHLFQPSKPSHAFNKTNTGQSSQPMASVHTSPKFMWPVETAWSWAACCPVSGVLQTRQRTVNCERFVKWRF